MELDSKKILENLNDLSDRLHWDSPIEILLIGGAAGMLTGQLSPRRVTLDCDIMHYAPEQAQDPVLKAAHQVAAKQGLPENWLNFQQCK